MYMMKVPRTKMDLAMWAAVSILLSYYLYRPLPDGVAEPLKTWQIMTMLHMMHDVAFLGEWLGIASAIELNRLLTDTSARTVRFPWFSTLEVTDTTFNGVSVRVYDPKYKQPNSPALMFYHGGGWVFGSIDTHDHVTRTLAEKLQMVVVSVDYRLAPEHPYPVPLEDCLNATLYFMKNAAKFGVDPARIAISGDSAGGNLAAAVTLKLRERSDVPQPRLQVLVYPALQMFDLNLPAYLHNDGAVYGTKEILVFTMLNYMGFDRTYMSEVMANNHTSPQMRAEYGGLVCTSMLPHQDTDNSTASPAGIGNWAIIEKLRSRLLDPFFMPLMSRNLTGLPKAYIITAGYDVLRDDGILYAKRLERDRVSVTWEHYPGAYHGFLAFIEHPLKTQIGIRAMDRLVAYLKAEL